LCGFIVERKMRKGKREGMWRAGKGEGEMENGKMGRTKGGDVGDGV